MSPEQLDKLRAYAAATPALAALAAVGDDTGLMAALNAATGGPVPGLVEIATVQAALHTMTHASGLPCWHLIKKYAGGSDPLGLAGAAGAEAVFALGVACEMVIDSTSAKYVTMDFSLPAVQAFIGGLVAGTLLTQSQADALAALASRRLTVAESALGVAGVSVSVHDCGVMRNGE